MYSERTRTGTGTGVRVDTDTDTQVEGIFVGEKVSKIRWLCEGEDTAGAGATPDTAYFLTGSWDHRPKITLYAWACREDHPSSIMLAEGPKAIDSFALDGDATQIERVQCGDSVVAVSTAAGGAVLLSSSRSGVDSRMKKLNSWENLHRFGDGSSCPCTSLATMDGDIVTIGEDGRMNFLTAHRNRPIKTIEDADCCALRSVCFLKRDEVIAGNSRGRMKIWDLRSSGANPGGAFLPSGDGAAVTCLAHHPTQRHLVLAGDENGALAVWDLRVNAYPASLLNAHSAAVLEIRFHPDHPQMLFTCSAGGEIWHWNTSSVSKPITNFSNVSRNESSINPWLMNDEDKANMDVSSLLSTLHKPINSLDCHKNRVLCGCDNEAVYIIGGIYLD